MGVSFNDEAGEGPASNTPPHSRRCVSTEHGHMLTLFQGWRERRAGSGTNSNIDLADNKAGGVGVRGQRSAGTGCTTAASADHG